MKQILKTPGSTTWSIGGAARDTISCIDRSPGSGSRYESHVDVVSWIHEEISVAIDELEKLEEKH